MNNISVATSELHTVDKVDNEPDMAAVRNMSPVIENKEAVTPNAGIQEPVIIPEEKILAKTTPAPKETKIPEPIVVEQKPETAPLADNSIDSGELFGA